MSDVFIQIREERNRIRAKRGVQDLEPERYLSILVEEVGEVAQAINDWREGEGYIGNAMSEMVQVCAVAIDMYERLKRLEDGDFKIMMDKWARNWLTRFEEELENECVKSGEPGKYIGHRPRNRGVELHYEFVSGDNSKGMVYTINLKKIERDKVSPSAKANEVIKSVRRNLLGKDNEENEE